MAAEGRNWTVERHAPDSFTIDIDCDRYVHTAVDQWFLLRSDAHWDNTHCDRKMERRHLDAAVLRNAIILDGGDLFCAMQGKYDKRADKTQLREEYLGNYLDLLTHHAAEHLEPYAHHFALMCHGNHETSIRKRHETDLTATLVDKLNERTGSTIQRGVYRNWVRIRFGPRGRKSMLSVYLYQHHGYGGGGPVTRGVIQSNRMAVYLPDPHVVWTGHTHDAWIVPIERARCTSKMRTFNDRQYHVRTPGYKDEFGKTGEGWHHERGGPPKPTGALWMRIRCTRDKQPILTFEEAR